MYFCFYSEFSQILLFYNVDVDHSNHIKTKKSWIKPLYQKKQNQSGQMTHPSTRKIKKVAVLGSGIMGSGIACQFANIGLEVIMLDIVPFDLKEK